MNTQTRKRVALQTLAGCLVAVIAWMALAEPLRKQRAESESLLESQRREIAAFEKGETRLLEEPLESLRALRDRARRIESLGGDAANFDLVHQRFGQLALQTGVRLDRLEPMRAPNGGTGDAEMFRAIGYRATFAGPYDAVARYIAAIENTGPGTRIESCRIRPEPSNRRSDLVAVVIETSHAGLVAQLLPRSNAGGNGS